MAGSASTFKVWPRDAQGNVLLVSSRPSFTVIGRGPSRSSDFLGHVAEAPNDDGSYNVRHSDTPTDLY